MSDQPKGVHIFSNGFEYDNWQVPNCDRCIKEPTCPLIEALFTDSLVHDFPSGNVTPETAARLGYSDEYIGVLGWPCAERQTQADPPSPAAGEMRKAGGVMLPGFDSVPTADAKERPWQA